MVQLSLPKKFIRIGARNALGKVSVLGILVFALFFLIGAPNAHADTTPKALLYVTATQSSLDSLRAHADSMDIVAPQTYAATPAGKLLGTPNPAIIQIANSAGASVMPLVVNQDFSQPGIDQLLSNTVAQDRLIVALIAEGLKQHYIGFQYDFEHIPAEDSAKYSAFVARSAPLFHAAGLELSIAVAPKQSDNPLDYGVGSWENWTGAFDYAALGKSADFLSVMAYDDSESVGPTASLPWVKQVLSYTLAKVPAQKISLGIPFYTWVDQTSTGTLDHIVTYPSIATVLDAKTYLGKGWSDALGVSWVTYKKAGKSYTAWYEDQKSFQEKIALVTSNNLYGFSAWALGQEDPNIWDVVLAMRTPRDGLALNTQ